MFSGKSGCRCHTLCIKVVLCLSIVDKRSLPLPPLAQRVVLYHRSELKPTKIPTLWRPVRRKTASRLLKTSASDWMLPRSRSRTIWIQREIRFLGSFSSRTTSSFQFWDPATRPPSRYCCIDVHSRGIFRLIRSSHSSCDRIRVCLVAQGAWRL